MTLLLHFKEITQITLNKSHERNEFFSKSVKGQLENMEIGLKTYVKNMLDIADKNTKSEFESFESKFANIRMENHRYAVDLKNSSNILLTEKEEIIKIKTEISKKIEGSNKINEDLNSQTVDKFYRMSAEYDVLKVKFTEIAEFIKVLILIK